MCYLYFLIPNDYLAQLTSNFNYKPFVLHGLAYLILQFYNSSILVDTRTSDGGVICWIHNLLKACRGPYSQGTTSKIWYTYQRKLKCVKMQIVIFRINYLLVVHSSLLILLEFIRLSYV